MAKINHVTKKTENPFLNFYELDRESKTGKKGNIMWPPEQKMKAD